MNKKALSESDLCDKFIRPAMEQAGWDGMVQIYREFPLRAGRVVVRGRQARRDASTVMRADYALFFKPNIPLAVVEAKDTHASGTSSSMKNVAREVVLSAPTALPPLAEQARIVARVTEPRRLCADLRRRLAASQATQSHLAEALAEQAGQ